MSAPKYGHWDISLVGRFDPEEHLGFVYQITHIETGKSYIGCKHLWKFKKRKKVKEVSGDTIVLVLIILNLI